MRLIPEMGQMIGRVLIAGGIGPQTAPIHEELFPHEFNGLGRTASVPKAPRDLKVQAGELEMVQAFGAHPHDDLHHQGANEPLPGQGVAVRETCGVGRHLLVEMHHALAALLARLPEWRVGLAGRAPAGEGVVGLEPPVAPTSIAVRMHVAERDLVAGGDVDEGVDGQAAQIVVEGDARVGHARVVDARRVQEYPRVRGVRAERVCFVDARHQVSIRAVRTSQRDEIAPLLRREGFVCLLYVRRFRGVDVGFGDLEHRCVTDDPRALADVDKRISA